MSKDEDTPEMSEERKERFWQDLDDIVLVDVEPVFVGEPITSSTATRILLEIVNGDEHPETDTPVEADARRRYRENVREIRAKGGVVDVASEWS
jgi:hypothetical protein